MPQAPTTMARADAAVEQGGPWTPGLRELWHRIEAHAFDGAQRLSFTRRLARDRAWSIGFACAAIEEYRRFCFLASVGASPVTPSEEVDEVWHLHLAYSRDYWEVWCRDVLRAPLHHDPTQGGPTEQTRFRQQYAATLAAYERFFGPPPEAFWPATSRRFGARPRFRVTDVERSFILPHPMGLLRRLRRLS